MQATGTRSTSTAGAEATPAEAAPAGGRTGEPEARPDPLVEDELLVEEISIDGMCGVY